MALWYDCGKGFVKAYFARGDIKADGYLCCPGPSLREVDNTKLHIPGAMVFALNSAYPKIRPDVWIGMDFPECYDRRLWWEPFMKITRGSFRYVRCENTPIKDLPNVYFADCAPNDPQKILTMRQHDTSFVWQNSTLVTALHIMIWMGVKYINLVGCDFGGKADYYDERVLTDSQRDRNRRLYDKQIAFLKTFKDQALSYGIELRSCTPESPINEFTTYHSLDEALEYSMKRAPSSGGDLFYCTDAKGVTWCSRSKFPRGVMVGVSPQQEDLLNWWMLNYLKYNNYPIAFADFGVSNDVKRIMEHHGLRIDMTKIEVEGWFRKPFAILRAPFQQIIWNDVDIEVRGNFQSYFDMIADDKIVAGHDSYEPPAFRTHIPVTGKLYDSGLLAVEHGSGIVKAWAEKIYAMPNRSFYLGDHEVLSLVLLEKGMPLVEIPKTMHRMRVEGDVEGLVTMHWTGPQGKSHIREFIKESTHHAS